MEMTNHIDCLWNNNHVNYSGNYMISGTVDKLGVPGNYNVYLFSKNMHLLRGILSNSDGTYEFKWISNITNGYFIIAFDRNAPLLNAAIADLVTPEKIT